jgi:hypothetical protein
MNSNPIPTTAFVAELLGVNESRVRQLVKELNLNPSRVRGAMIFNEKEIKVLKNRNTQRGPAKKPKK